MSVQNPTTWVEIDIAGEVSGDKYFGRFLLKHYLGIAERSDAARLATVWNRGIDDKQHSELIELNTALAYLKFHIVETDAPWWKDFGLNVIDTSPVQALSDQLIEERNKAKAARQNQTLASATV